MFVLWWNVEGILLHLGQGMGIFRVRARPDTSVAEPEVAGRAALYLRWLSLSLPGYGGNVIVKKRAFPHSFVNVTDGGL